MCTLNSRYDYGLQLYLLSIDEGISGYRDDSLETVKTNKIEYGLPLEIISYKDLYGHTMDDIVKQVGRKNNCTFCGVFRRQALDRGAWGLGVGHIVTGHNADDIAETVLMNSELWGFPPNFPIAFCSGFSCSHERRYSTSVSMHFPRHRIGRYHQAV